MHTIIVAFNGNAGAGKDTTANHLVSHYGFVKISFADTLREVCKTVFGLTEAEMSDRRLKEQPLDRWPFQSPRSILQKVGTECFRTYFPGVWIKAFERLIANHERVVAADCRFPDEGDFVHSRGGWVVRIDGKETSADASAQAHASEQQSRLVRVDDHIRNDRDITHLYAQVDRLMIDYGLHKRPGVRVATDDGYLYVPPAIRD